MRLVILESPFAGNVAKNVAYARACVRDSLMRGESPIASHLLYTQPGIGNDDIPAERALGIAAGLAWCRVAEASVVYTDLGISPGMQQGIERAEATGLRIEYRKLWRTAFSAAPFPAEGDFDLGLLDANQVALRYSVSVRSVFRWAGLGTFPAPLKPAPGICRWSVKSLLEYEQQLDAQRGGDRADMPDPIPAPEAEPANAS